MSKGRFVQQFAGVYEHSPWVAEAVAGLVDDDAGIDEIARLMADCVDNASPERQLALIRAHPDLAGRARMAGELTAESTSEQASAGLDRCTAGEYERFQRLNERYRRKFGFPFVMAVRDRSRGDILSEFERRLQNDPAVEFETALVEIHKIANMRLRAMARVGGATADAE